MQIGEVVRYSYKQKISMQSQKISVSSQKPGCVQSMCSLSLTPDTCYLLTLTSLPASVTLIYPTFSLAWTGEARSSEHRDNITAGTGSISPATCHLSHDAVVYECSSDPFNTSYIIIGDVFVSPLFWLSPLGLPLGDS